MAEKYTIEKLGAFGEGVAHSGRDGKVVFIKGALPGEVVLAEDELVKKSFVRARLIKPLNSSKDRVDPPCPYFFSCGGCALQHLSYEAQLALKRQTVEETLLKVAGMSKKVDEVVPSSRIYRYRNKLSFPVQGKKIGLYTENSHDVVNISDCLIQREWNKPLVEALRLFMTDYGLRRGGDMHAIRHLVAREKNGLGIVLVTRGEVDISRFADYIPFADFALYQNVNNGNNNVIFGKDFRFVAGRGRLPDFHPASFYQVNDDIEARLYDDVARACEGELVIDAYCGAGNLTLRLAKSAAMVYGVEIVPEAVIEARARASKQAASNVTFICGDCAVVLPRLAEQLNADPCMRNEGVNIDPYTHNNDEIDRVTMPSGRVNGKTVILDPPRKGVDKAALSAGTDFASDRVTMPSGRVNGKTVILDPPRKGVDKAALAAVTDLAPDKIIYVSCNPATLARDLIYLTQNYTISSVTAYDMFPQTPHVETLVVLSHKKPDGHIGVKVEFGEGEGQISLKEVEKRAEARKPKEKVTYKIKQ